MKVQNKGHIMGIWDNFWVNKGKKMEWSKEDIINSKNLSELSSKVLHLLKRRDFQDIELLELGAGMGITSYFFANNGVKVTLLDKSIEAKRQAEIFWRDKKHTFICADLFNIEAHRKYDLVSSFGLCEHFIGKERETILQKHLDFLKSGGVAIISVPHKNGIFYQISKFLAKLTRQWSFGLEVPFSKQELINFAKKNRSKYEIIISGFYSSAYDLFIRKPLKLFRISIKRRFDNTKSIFDYPFGSGIIIIIKKA